MTDFFIGLAASIVSGIAFAIFCLICLVSENTAVIIGCLLFGTLLSSVTVTVIAWYRHGIGDLLRKLLV